MNEAERIARAERAERAYEEFVAPLLTNMREEYTGKVVQVASTELHPGTRSDKITTLSVALRVVETLEAGMKEAIKDGELARAAKLKAEKIEQMSDARQRLLRIVGV